MEKKLVLLIIFLAVSFSAQDVLSQCAMCRASVESSLSTGESSSGAGLNNGILYLMSVPYIVLAVVGFFWYKSSRKNMEDRLKVEKKMGQAIQG